MKNLKIGLFGFGVVGEGIYQVLSSKQNLGLDIKKIVIKHPDKLRNAPSALFFTNRDAIIKDPEIDVVVELIDDSAAAFEIVKEALAAGKHVVSGNKKMIAENLPALLQLKESSGKSLLYEAAVGGSIPILRNLEEYFDNDLLHYVSGIVNGSTNYILTKMIEEAKGFDEALNLAKDNGFAESNPIMDVEGFDASFKLQIIALHAFGLIVPNDNILRKGIQSLLKGDIQFAFEKGCVIKLIAKIIENDNGYGLSVFPTFLPKDHSLAKVQNEYNGILIGSHLSDEQFFQGKGAGRFPTSSAILSDLSALKYAYQYAYKKGAKHLKSESNGQGRFLLSSKADLKHFNSAFEIIDEKCERPGYNYTIGTLKTYGKRWNEIIENKEVSIIAFEN